ncbi:hypothetical protein BDZ94DRAFT_1269587 [Collybia nuda]|uniref:Uncharacterized protein n=1 Tax=Collybia nuda TaxID=64659 RepID=A0A9P5XWG9_9AGAR|nr:hypothetical protein BDZ94DRAFT_1269587 [Collybia nuda]
MHPFSDIFHYQVDNYHYNPVLSSLFSKTMLFTFFTSASLISFFCFFAKLFPKLDDTLNQIDEWNSATDVEYVIEASSIWAVTAAQTGD